MKSSTAVVLFFVIMIVGSFAMYHVISTVQANRHRENHEKLCAFMTDELNNQITEDSEYVSYYCYYKPYAPPEGYEATQTLCACEGKMKDGTVVSVQVLTPK